MIVFLSALIFGFLFLAMWMNLGWNHELASAVMICAMACGVAWGIGFMHGDSAPFQVMKKFVCEKTGEACE